MIYHYTEGNKISRPNTYFYTPFHGGEFFSAFDFNRKTFLGVNANYKEPSRPELFDEKITSNKNIDTFKKLEHIFFRLLKDTSDSNVYAEIERFRRKFEVTKTIHRFYDEKWNPVNKGGMHELSLYVRLAQIFEAVYSSKGKVTYLNVLLKIIDSLISVKHDLSKEQMEYVNWLILREREHIDELKKLHIAVE